MERIRQRDPLAAGALSRLGIALLVSAAAHVALLSQIDTAPNRAATTSVVEARIVSLPPPPAPRPARRVSAVAYVRENQPVAPVSIPEIAAPPQRLRAEHPAIAVPVDLNYYSARELDVYPVPLQPIEVISPPEAHGRSGRVQVLTLIDETGRVTETQVFDAEPAHMFDPSAISAIRDARFAPARKRGREVRSRVLIELNFSPQP